jgi:amidophosphoribosyltransferase
MSGFFGSVSKTSCVHDVFYGTDYHSHLGTKRAGMVVYSPEKGFQRAIHSLEDGYFRNKFESNLSEWSGTMGIGVISDTEAQPILVTTLGHFQKVISRFLIGPLSSQRRIRTNGNYQGDTCQNSKALKKY